MRCGGMQSRTFSSSREAQSSAPRRGLPPAQFFDNPSFPQGCGKQFTFTLHLRDIDVKSVLTNDACQPLFVYVIVLAALAVGPIALVAEQRESPGKVDVLLTTAPTLSKSARASMISEAAAIWRRYGVQLVWLPPTTIRAVASNRLRVLIVQKKLAVGGAAELIAVGQLVRPSDAHPVALNLIESAQHLMSSVRGRAGYELIAIDERRFGTVLGRALARARIGHYLLDTHTHARSGLMRPNFNALEFTDLRNRTFALDRAAAAWLRTRDVEKFAY